MTEKNDDLMNDDDFLDDSFDDDFDFDDFELEEDGESETGEGGEEVSFASDEAEEASDEDIDALLADDEIDSNIISKEKKSFIPELSFNTIVIIGAVIVGGIVMVFQVTKKPPQVGPQDTFVSGVRMQGASDGLIFGETNVNTAEIENTTNEDTGENGDTDFLNNPDALDSLEIEIKDPPPMPTPIANQEANEFLDEFEQPLSPSQETEMDATAENNNQPTPRAPVDANQELDDFFNNVELMSDTSTNDNAEEDTQTVEPATQSENNEDLQITTITESVEIENQTEEVAEPTSNTVSPDIEQRLTSLEERVNNSANNNQNNNSQEIEELNKTVASLQSEITRLKQQAKSQSTAPIKTTSRPKSIEWDLRAAQPGKAWVSQQGSQQLQPVVVGDVLSGIGRIQDIFYENNRWVIKGSSKSIYQKN